jgi:hypothetical protein
MENVRNLDDDGKRPQHTLSSGADVGKGKRGFPF